jgi:hypothetical protein
MAIGQQYSIKFHEDTTGTPVLDSVRIAQFTHDSSLVSSVTTVKKEDFTGTPNDAFEVKISYPSGSIPSNSTSLATFLTTAVNAVNTALGNGEAGPST